MYRLQRCMYMNQMMFSRSYNRSGYKLRLLFPSFTSKLYVEILIICSFVVAGLT